MTNVDRVLVDKIANWWANALGEKCHEQFGEGVFLSIICAVYAYAMAHNFGCGR